MALVVGYASLQTDIADYLARSDLTSYIPGLIQKWEERFYREPENWGSWMESTLNVTITAGSGAVPADYLAVKTAYLSGAPNQPLKRMSLEQIYLRYPRTSSGGSPVYFARAGSNFIFGPAGAGTMVGTYWAKPTVLRSYTTGGADAAAHFLIVNAPDLCTYGSLIEAMPFVKNDARLQTWTSLYSVALDAYRARVREEDMSGGAPQTVVA